MRWHALLLLLAVASPARAQEMGAETQHVALGGPRFLDGAGPGARPVEPTSVAALQRRVTLTAAAATLGDALREITQQTGVRFLLSRDVVPVTKVVRVEATGLSLAAALTELLLNTEVDVAVASPTELALVRRRGAGTQPGSIVGRVTDANSGQGLAGAEVVLEKTKWRAATGEDGQYRLAEVAPGSYTLAVRRIGYAKRTQPVTVASGEEVTADVALEPVATQLDEIVTTVTGDQRRVELGHVVGRINADSLVKEAPISSLSELLTARVPGLQVFQNQGTVGGSVNLQIRGPNSLLLSNAPVVIMDGVRYTSTATLQPGALTSGPTIQLAENSSPLNHLNVNDIESIEVVKGPSAATLYGTDAANGVLVITTKRGRPGPARWNVYAKARRTEISTRNLQDSYWGWGTVNGVPDNPNLACTLDRLASGVCTQQDSVTVIPHPGKDPGLTVLAAKPAWESGMSVAGGTEDLRYYVSADFEDATGPIQMPVAFADRLRQQRGLSELPEEWREPNALSNLNLRTNMTARLGKAAELRINSGYVHANTRELQGTGGFSAVANGTPVTPYHPFSNPAETFLETSTEETERFFGSGSGEWRPASWLTTRATVGLDLNHGIRSTLARRGDRPNTSDNCSLGCVYEERVRQVATSAELGATAMARRGRLSWRTSVGAQYVRTLSDVVANEGWDLIPGGTSLLQAANTRIWPSNREAVTLGSYLEETLGLNDRLFLTGALRVDGASTFGRGYDAAAYPKVNASWLVSEEPFLPRLPGLDELRLRYAFGASGQQPDPRWAGPQFITETLLENGHPTVVYRLASLGNPALRPERVREHEFGFEVAALGSRLGLELTWTRRRTADQIASVLLPPGMGSFGSIFTNLGLTRQRGFEAQLTARLLETRLVRWDVTLQHSVYRTMLEDIGGGLECSQVLSQGRPQEASAALGCYREGYPLGARFSHPVVGYGDTNGDGIIAGSEVQFSDTLVYMGLGTPPRSQTLTTVLGLFDGRLRLSTILERQTGFTQVNGVPDANNCGLGSGLCQAGAVDPSTPLEEQARAWDPGVFEPGDYTRLLEVAAALDLPPRVAAALHVRSATVVVSGRNLALWSDFSGPDPGTGGFASGLSSLPDRIPLGRTWALRVDIGF